MVLSLNLGKDSYDIVVERGALDRVGTYLSLNRKVLILTDSGVPRQYAEKVLSASKEGYIFTIEQGEKSKSFESYKDILSFMVEKSFTRGDCVVSVGGGVCGDLGGFVASTYMRGIDFYNVPTTLLSQVDSSIGGKVAVDFNGIKNIIGAFYQPKKVVIDSETLKTLDKRQTNAGLCESLKMGCTCNSRLFEIIENTDDLEKDMDEIIVESLKIKGDVVEKDPKEKSLRKVLNFGHTVGHAIEAVENGNLLHGECVGIGMLYMCSAQVKGRIIKVLNRLGIGFSSEYRASELMHYIERDKKAKGGLITVVYVNEVGTFELRDIEISQIKDYISGDISK